MEVMEEIIEGEVDTAVKHSFVVCRSQIWEKEETFRAPHGQKTRMESEGEGLGMELVSTRASCIKPNAGRNC